MKKTIIGLVAALALFGCGGGGGHHSSSSSSSTQARIAFVNASPDSATLDFRLNGDVKASAVAFGAATAFSSVGPQDADFAVRPTGGNADLWDEASTLTVNTDNLIVAVGLVTPPSDSTTTPPTVDEIKRLQLEFKGIDRTAPTGSRARLIVVNAFVRQAGYETPSIDVKTTDVPTSVDFTGIAFGGFSTQDIDSGTVNLEVIQSNTDQVFVAATPLTLAPGGIYLALVSGTEGSATAAPSIRLVKLAAK